jgi:hypothetical protein
MPIAGGIETAEREVTQAATVNLERRPKDLDCSCPFNPSSPAHALI